eukprot:scaffold16730_cov120-Skeletonema_marinoi.AAC.1
MSDVIGVSATDEIVAQMYNEHFEQETFKSDVAKAVINTYYNDAEVVSTTKRLVWIHKRYAMYAVTITKLELLRTNNELLCATRQASEEQEESVAVARVCLL